MLPVTDHKNTPTFSDSQNFKPNQTTTILNATLNPVSEETLTLRTVRAAGVFNPDLELPNTSTFMTMTTH